MTRGMAVLGVMALVVLLVVAGSVRTAVLTRRSQASTSQERVAEKTRVVAHGEKVNLREHLVRGKTTVFDFYSEYCPACMMLAPELDKLAAKRPDMAVVKVDVNRPEVRGQIDWESPVVQQHGIDTLPHLVLFDAHGKQTASGPRALDEVVGWLGS
ncbi:MAG: thioredoxin family protein [Armatimonadetes bacterium]|nr:thioredoxin family protein [Armatimonadota bacterium]